MKAEPTCVRVFDVFKNVQLEGSNTISHQLRYGLEDLLATDPNGALEAIQQAYLQIAQAITTAKRPTQKFSNLMKDMCQQLEKIREAPEAKRRERPIEPRTVLQFFSRMIDLFSEMGLSTYKSVRMFGARTLFMVLHSTRLQELADDISPNILKTTANCVLELLRERQIDYRKCGIKLASTLQSINCSELNAHIEAIVYELLKIISTDDNEELRLMAVKNLVLKQATLKQFFLRLRDKSPEIRVTVFKKLIAERIAIHELGLANLYKVFYDGISSREEVVKHECINCFSYYLDPQKESGETRYFDFLNMFNPNVLLHYPHLYTAFCELTSKVLESFPESQTKNFQAYLRHLCITMKSKPPTIEIFYVRIASTLPTYNAIVDEHYMSGVEQAAYLDKCFRSNHYFEFMECLRLASKFINIDEKGRNDIFNALTQVLRTPTQHIVGIPAEALEYENDICGRLSKEDIERMRLMNPYYYEPLIHDTEDLVLPIVRLLKEIRPDSFCNELQQLISDIRPDNPENNLLREWEIVNATIEKLKSDKKDTTIKAFEGKRTDLIRRITVLKMRIINIMRGLLENSQSVSDPIFRSIAALLQGNRPNEMLLNGLYGLIDLDKAKLAFQMVWNEVNTKDPESNEESQNLLQMVCIRVATDLIIKYKLLNQFPEDLELPETFSIFLGKQMFFGESQVRAVAIESMCKLLYHDSIKNPNLNFVYILMLWWDTKTEEGSAKSVHVISTFIKQYMEKSAENFQDMSHLLQVYFSVLNTIQSSSKVIKKTVLKYTLKFSAFIQRSLQIAMTILRYTKQDGTLRAIPHLRKDRPKDSIEIGPQESFIMFILKENGFDKFIDSSLDNSDCLKQTPTEVLKLLQQMLGELNRGQRTQKGKHFLADVERRLSVKGQPDPKDVSAYEAEFKRQYGVLQQEVKQVYKNINDLGLLATTEDAEASDSDEEDCSVVDLEDKEASSSSVKEVQHQPRRRR